MNDLLKIGGAFLFTKGWETASTYLSESVVEKGVSFYRWHRLCDAIVDFVNSHPLATFCFAATFGFAANTVSARISYNRALLQHQILLERVHEEGKTLRMMTASLMTITGRGHLNNGQEIVSVRKNDATSSSPPPAESSSTTIVESSSSPAVVSPTSALLLHNQQQHKFRNDINNVDAIAESTKLVELTRQDLKQALLYTSISAGISVVVLTFESYIRSPYANRKKDIEPKIEYKKEVKESSDGTTTTIETPIQVNHHHRHNSSGHGPKRAHDILISNYLETDANVYVYNNADMVRLVSADKFRLKSGDERMTGGNYASSLTNGAQICLETIPNVAGTKCRNVSLGCDVKLSEIA